jgi:hypothetical protein
LPKPIAVADGHEVFCLLYDEEYRAEFPVKEMSHV